MDPAQIGGATAVTPYTHAYSQAALGAAAVTDLGDWSNDAALACIFALGTQYNSNFVLSLLVKPPPSTCPTQNSPSSPIWV
jgi:hypothetical protein